MMISPQGRVIQFHNALTVILTLYSCLFYSFMGAFRHDIEFPSYLEYLNHMSEQWYDMYYHSREQIKIYNTQ